MTDRIPEKTEAIVLRAIPWSETSLIVTLWTRQYGKIGAMAKGARRLRSPFESALDLLAHSSVVFISKSGDALDLLTEAKLIRRFRSSQQNLLHLYCGYYVAELLLFATEEGQPIPELFDLSTRTLIDLDTTDYAAEIMLRFELHLLRLLGLAPSLDLCASCGSEVDSSKAMLGIEAGGLLCGLCLPGQRDVIRLATKSLDALRNSLSLPWQSEGLGTSKMSLDSSVKRDVRRFTQRYLVSNLHRPFGLHPFLEGLSR